MVVDVHGTELDLSALCTALIEDAPDGVVVLERGIVRYVNPAVTGFLGWRGDQMLGRHIVEFVHPDDAARAALDLEIHAAPNAPRGYSQYSVARADGSWLRVALSAVNVTVGAGTFMALYCRPANLSAASVLSGLLRGSTPKDMLAPVCEFFDWEAYGSRVGISWADNTGFDWVSTDLPANLVGGDGASDTPWAVCRRERRRQRATDLSALGDHDRHLAEVLGLGAYWIEPVLDDDGQVCAVITVWMAQSRPVPEIHSLGMSMAKDSVELIMRWVRQARQLYDAAHRDPLTGLANRKAFFESLGHATGGALLYCDLDRFKSVNDHLSHQAGDELLRAVANRIRGCVRASDVVARLGGDEFAVLCLGATREQAQDLARRIRIAISQPFQIDHSSVRVGISIGVAHSPDALGDTSLQQADRALYQAKADARSATR
jgi:diguanylate cyclase (GGDEF)-like protein/PAS domain S-box-containing protein